MRISNEPSLTFTTMVKLKPRSLKSTAYLKLLLPNGSSSIQPLKLMMVKFLLQSRLKHYKSVWLNSKKKTKYKKSDCHIHATLKQRLEAVYKLRNQYEIKTLCRVLKVNRSTYYKHYYSQIS